MSNININLNEQSGKILYIVAGCNGAGKTTAFRNRLSEQFNVPIFINADEIAREMCPFQREHTFFTCSGSIGTTSQDIRGIALDLTTL